MPAILEKPNPINVLSFPTLASSDTGLLPRAPEGIELSKKIEEIIKELKTIYGWRQLLQNGHETDYNPMTPTQSYMIQAKFSSPQRGRALPYSLNDSE